MLSLNSSISSEVAFFFFPPCSFRSYTCVWMKLLSFTNPCHPSVECGGLVDHFSHREAQQLLLQLLSTRQRHCHQSCQSGTFQDCLMISTSSIQMDSFYLAASTNAILMTFRGSTIPASTMSMNSPAAASKTKILLELLRI